MEIVVMDDFLLLVKEGTSVDAERLAVALGKRQEPLGRSLGRSELRIVDFLDKHGPSTPTQVAEGIGLGYQTTVDLLSALANASVINRVARGLYQLREARDQGAQAAERPGERPLPRDRLG